MATKQQMEKWGSVQCPCCCHLQEIPPYAIHQGSLQPPRPAVFPRTAPHCWPWGSSSNTTAHTLSALLCSRDTPCPAQPCPSPARPGWSEQPFLQPLPMLPTAPQLAVLLCRTRRLWCMGPWGHSAGPCWSGWCEICSSDSCQYGTMLGPHCMMNVTFCLAYPCITTSLRKTEWLMYIVLVSCKGMF